MSLENEVKAVEKTVIADAEKVEAVVGAKLEDVAEAVAEGVKDAKSAAEEVKANVEADAKKIEQKLAATAKKVRVDITTEEKLFLRDAEAEFLRAQVEIKDLQSKIQSCAVKAEAASKKYTAKLEELIKKYGIDKAEMLFDNIENAFKALGKKL